MLDLHRTALWAAGLLACCLLASAHAAGEPSASCSIGADRIVLETAGCRCTFDRSTGALLELTRAGAEPLVVGTADGSLWTLAFRDGTSLTAAAAAKAARPTAYWDQKGATLTLAWRSGPADVTVAVRAASADRLELAATVNNRSQSPVLTLSLPHQLAFTARGLNLVTWPDSVGLGLTREWFSRPATAEPSTWEDQPLADTLMRRLVGFGARMLDLPGTPRPLRVTAQGRQVLGEGLASTLQGREATVLRPPDGPAEAVLLENSDGPYLSAFHLGGKGWFAYFGGKTEAEVIVPCAMAMIRAWAPKAPGGHIALIDLRGQPAGGWSEATLADWQRALAARPDGLAQAQVRSAPELAKALADSGTSVVVNPYAEHLVADSPKQADALVDAIRAFVRRGGLWIDAGNYPFYYILKPARYGHIDDGYPPCFSDLIHIDSSRGRLAVYVVRPSDEIFVPASLHLAGARFDGQDTGVYTHDFRTWVAPGKTWTAPTVVLRMGLDLKTAARDYAADNGFTATLRDKLPAAKLQPFLDSVLVRLGGGRTCKAYEDYLPQLPSPNIVHMTEHLAVGFDKAYPDYLPPRPRFGTMADLRALYREAHRLGLLMMPYVNPTWWPDKSPSLKKYGDQVLAVGLDGKHYREVYGRNGGWSICALDPIVRQLDDRCLREFVDDLGSDLLFQDQIGARGFLYDLNPAEPTPYAYTQGMIDLAKHDCRTVPLGTERGWDQLINYETQFCGVGWAVVPSTRKVLWSGTFWDDYAAGQWRISPLALYEAHDKVAFTLHDLGQFVTGEPQLAMVLPLGHQLSYALGVGASKDSPGFRWLQWLDVLQKQVVSRYMLAPLDEFGHLSQLAVRGRYGDMTVAGNIEKRPMEVGDVTLASPGWYARSRDGSVEAGRLVHYAGRDYDPPLEFVRVRRGGVEHWWLYGNSPVLLPAEGAKSAVEGAAQGGPALPLVSEGGKQYVRATPSAGGHEPPANLAGKAPEEWAQRPKYVGIIDMKPGGPAPGWADAGPEQWVTAVAKSPLVTKFGLQTRELTDPADILRACSQPREWLCILNPYGEVFPVSAADKVDEMLSAVQSYVADGGIWWETGGFSFFYPCWPVRKGGRIVGWDKGAGVGGLGRLLGAPASLPDAYPAERLTVTPAGRALLGQAAAAALDKDTASINRPLPDSYGGWELVGGPSGAYVAGYQVGGWGYLFRAGGPGQIAVSLPCVEATLEHLYQTPPRDWPVAQPPHVWQMIVRR